MARTDAVVWVLTWRYGDGSGSGVVRAYASGEEAKRDIAMLRTHGGVKDFDLMPVEFVGRDFRRDFFGL